MVEIKPSVRRDFTNLYGTYLTKTFKAVTVFIDGKPVGIGGIYYSNDGTPLAFARITDQLRPYKVSIYKAALKVREIIEDEPSTVYAIADKKINKSDDLLMKLGFVYCSATDKGDLYEWIG